MPTAGGQFKSKLPNSSYLGNSLLSEFNLSISEGRRGEKTAKENEP